MYSRMRCDPDVVRSKATVKPADAFLPRHLERGTDHTDPFAIDDVATLLHPRLDKVERQAEEARKEPCDRRTGQGLLHGRHRVQSLTFELGQLGFRLGKEGELTKVEGHGAGDGRHGTAPQRDDTLLGGDIGERVEDVGIVGAHVSGFQPVRLHTDQSQIGGVAQHRSYDEARGKDMSSMSKSPGRGRQRTQSSCRQSSDRPLLEPDLSTLRKLAHEGVKQSQTGGGVYRLSQQAGREPGVQLRDWHGSRDGQWVGGLPSGRGELDSDLISLIAQS